MKKILIITGIIFLIMIGGVIAFPYFFKDDILRAVKRDLNRNLKAQVDFGDVNLSLFKSFPDLYFEVENISVVNTDSVFKDIPLAKIGKFGMILDVMDLFKGKKNIKEISLQDADFVVLVRPDGKANYDIMKNETEPEEDTSSTDLEIHLENYQARNIRLLYDDASLGMKIYMSGLNHEGNAVLKDGNYYLTGVSTADTLDVEFDRVKYLKKTQVKLQDTISIEKDFSLYGLNIKGTINHLPVFLKGSIEMKPNDDIAMDLDFGSEGGSLEKMLSLVPAEYMPDLPQMEIRGDAMLSGEVKGVYNEKNYPSYVIQFNVDNGLLKGKDLPESIRDIKVNTTVDFPGGPDLDATVIDMPAIKFNVAGNPVAGRLNVQNPMTDPFVNTAFQGKLDLKDFKKALPLKNIKELAGKLDADIDLKARVSDMEKQHTEKIKAKGYFNLENFVFVSDSVPLPVRIHKAQTEITPVGLKFDVKELQAGESDFNLSGNVTNYLAYFTGKDSVLEARMKSHSRFINMNELMSASGDEEVSSDTTSLHAFRIPGGITALAEFTADKMLYKDMELADVKAQAKVENKKAELTTVLMKTFGGEMQLQGIYDSAPEQVVTSLKMKMQKMKVDETARSLTYFKAYAPILKYFEGIFGMDFDLNVRLDDQMNPILSTTDAQGKFEALNLRPENVKFFQNAAQVLKLDALANPVLSKAVARFGIEDGNLNINPFDFKVNGMKSKLGGSVTLDKKLDLDWNLEIPVEKLGAQANQWLNSIQGELSKLGLKTNQIKTVYVTLKITGDINKPSIKPVFRKGEGMQGLTETVKETVVQTVKQEAQQLEDTLRQNLDAQAQALIQQAEQQGDRLIAEAKKMADQIKKEADKQAEELIKKAGDNPIAKFAAQKSAEKLKKKAYQKADALVEEAKRKKQKLIEEAKAKAQKIKEGKLVK